MKVHKKWIFLMSAMVIFAIAGLFAGEPSFTCDFSKISAADVAWLITATIFVLMMTPGLSFFYGGMVGAKNVISTMLQSFIAMGIISVLWVVFGFSLAFGDDVGGVIGNPSTFLMFQGVGANTYITPTGKVLGGATIPLALYALFQMKFAIITPSLITGSFAERVRFSAYLFFMIWFFVVIYCPLAHMTWHPDGLFLQWGVVDFAGGIVVHASSGVAALAGALFLGRRVANTRRSEPANIPFVLLGAAMLWLGWFGFNAGSSLHADGQAVKVIGRARNQAGDPRQCADLIFHKKAEPSLFRHWFSLLSSYHTVDCRAGRSGRRFPPGRSEIQSRWGRRGCFLLRAARGRSHPRTAPGLPSHRSFPPDG